MTWLATAWHYMALHGMAFPCIAFHFSLSPAAWHSMAVYAADFQRGLKRDACAQNAAASLYRGFSKVKKRDACA